MKLISIVVTCFILIGCANRPIEYTVDPDVAVRDAKLSEPLVVSVNVIAPENQSTSDEFQLIATPSNQFAESVKQNLIKRFIQQGYKISSNKHFTNANLTFDFSKFQVTITKGTVKDEILADGQLNLLITQKDQQFKKSFSVRKKLTVALKATPPEVTGLANDVVGQLLTNALNDEEVRNTIMAAANSGT